MSRATIPLAILGLVACGEPEAAFTVELAPVCGIESPLRILSLRDDEVLVRGTGATTTYEGRWLVGVRTFAAPVEGDAWAGIDPMLLPEELAPRIESIDPCGGDRRVVGPSISRVIPPVQPGEPWLGIDERTQVLWTFDPAGDRPPRELAELSRRGPHEGSTRGRDVFALRGPSEDYVRITVEDDAIDIEVLVTDAIAVRPGSTQAGPTMKTQLVGRRDGTVVEVAVPSGVTRSLITGAASFDADAEERWILYEPGVPGADEPSKEVWLFDRTTGERERLGSTLVGGVAGSLIRGWARVEWYDGGEARVDFVRLSDRARGTFPPGTNYFGSTDDRLALLQSGGVLVYEAVDGELVARGGPFPATRGGETLGWGDPTPYPDGSGCYDLVELPLATATPSVSRRAVCGQVELPNGRWVQERHTGSEPNELSELRIVDAPGDTVVFEDAVTTGFANLYPDDPGTIPSAHDEIVYEVRGDPDRAGLWRAAFAR